VKGRVLIIAGSDPSGGAGIQADIKTVTALSGYAMTVITALTVQNTRGVKDVMAIPSDTVMAQIEACLGDIGADVIKIGMIASADLAQTLVEALPRDIPIVLDPVLVATSGDTLAAGGVAEILRDYLIPRSTIVTPNAPELSTLMGRPVTTTDEMRAAGRHLLEKTGVPYALLKGGHINGGDEIINLLMSTKTALEFPIKRLDTVHTHGTGCTLASAVATGLAQGLSPEDATGRAVAYVHGAIKAAPGFGLGHGPLNHAHAIAPFYAPTRKAE